MNDLRGFLEAVRGAGEIHEIRREVDPVHELGRVLAACERAGKAAYFHAVKGFDIPVVGSMLSTPKRIALALECEISEVGARMAQATEKPIPFISQAAKAPCQEVVIKKPDLTRWPIPTHSPLDAGPFITAGVVIARDPESGRHNLSYNRMQIYGPRPHRDQQEHLAPHSRRFATRSSRKARICPSQWRWGPDRSS